MKIKLLILLAIIAVFALPVMAQELPDTAGEAVGWLQVAIVALAGLVATRLTEALGNIPFLKNADKDKLRQPLLDLVAAVIAVGAAYIIGYATPLAAYLDDAGLWKVVVWAWPSALAWFKGLRLVENYS